MFVVAEPHSGADLIVAPMSHLKFVDALNPQSNLSDRESLGLRLNAERISVPIFGTSAIVSIGTFLTFSLFKNKPVDPLVRAMQISTINKHETGGCGARFASECKFRQFRNAFLIKSDCAPEHTATRSVRPLVFHKKNSKLSTAIANADRSSRARSNNRARRSLRFARNGRGKRRAQPLFQKIISQPIETAFDLLGAKSAAVYAGRKPLPPTRRARNNNKAEFVEPRSSFVAFENGALEKRLVKYDFFVWSWRARWNEVNGAKRFFQEGQWFALGVVMQSRSRFRVSKMETKLQFRCGTRLVTKYSPCVTSLLFALIRLAHCKTLFLNVRFSNVRSWNFQNVCAT